MTNFLIPRNQFPPPVIVSLSSWKRNPSAGQQTRTKRRIQVIHSLLIFFSSFLPFSTIIINGDQLQIRSVIRTSKHRPSTSFISLFHINSRTTTTPDQRRSLLLLLRRGREGHLNQMDHHPQKWTAAINILSQGGSGLNSSG